jgi:Domain of unknown function (DUF4377)
MLAVLSGMSLSACSQDTSKTVVDDLQFTVAANTGPCRTVQEGQDCLLVKVTRPQNSTASDSVWTPWSKYSTISGFTYQAGYKYKLIVIETSVISTAGDPPPSAYALKQLVEKAADSSVAVVGQP